jgi:hypothetical protein
MFERWSCMLVVAQMYMDPGIVDLIVRQEIELQSKQIANSAVIDFF